MEKNGEKAPRKFRLPLRQDTRHPDWAPEMLIGPAGIMEEDIRGTCAVERLRKIRRISIEIGDSIPLEQSTRFGRPFHDKEIGRRGVARPMFVRQPAIGADSAGLWWKARCDDDERARIHDGKSVLEKAPQNLRV